MKLSVSKQRLLERMAAGARLGWNRNTARYELRDGDRTLTIQARTISALEVAGFIEHEPHGDTVLSSMARRHARLATPRFSNGLAGATASE